MKKVGLLLGFALTLSQISAQSFKQQLNQGLTDYMVPLVGTAFLIGAIIGIMRNWKLINDEHTRKEGFIGIGVVILFVVVAVAALAAIIGLFSNLVLNV